MHAGDWAALVVIGGGIVLVYFLGWIAGFNHGQRQMLRHRPQPNSF